MIRFVDVLGWFGLLLAVSGGISWANFVHDKKILIELMIPGVFFAPAFLLLWRGKVTMEGLTFCSVLQKLYASLERVGDRSVIVLYASVGLCHWLGTTNRYLSFAGGWDLAIYANACANGLHSSFRNNASLLADHFEPLLLLFTPGCRAVDPVLSLLAVQAAGAVVGALGIRAFATCVRWSRAASFCAGLFYLVAEGLVGIVYYDFHLYALALATIPWLLVAMETKSWRLFACVAAAHLCLKETTALTIAAAGGALFLRQERRVGVIVGVIGLAAFVGVMQFVFPYFRDGAPSEYFGKYYGYLGNNLSAMLRTIITNPIHVIVNVVTWDRLLYLLKLLVPLAFLPLAAPHLILVAVPALAVNILSAIDTMYSTNFHYDAEIFPVFFMAAIYGSEHVNIIRHLQRVNLQPKILLLAAFTIFCAWIPPLARVHFYKPSRPQLELHNELSKLQPPPHCRVRIVDRLDPHVSFLANVSLIEERMPLDGDIFIVAYPQGDRLWSSSVDKITEMAAKWDQTFLTSEPLPTNPGFRLWYRDGCKPYQ